MLAETNERESVGFKLEVLELASGNPGNTNGFPAIDLREMDPLITPITPRNRN